MALGRAYRCGPSRSRPLVRLRRPLPYHTIPYKLYQWHVRAGKTNGWRWGSGAFRIGPRGVENKVPQLWAMRALFPPYWIILRSVCLVTLSLSEAGPRRFGRQVSVTDIYHTMGVLPST